MTMTKINVLGTEYTITYANETEDELLETCDGYCDMTVKRIVIAAKREDCELVNYEWLRRKVLRHEIIHAFLIESGVHVCYEPHEDHGHDEFIVDWIAIQFPKLLAAFKEAEAL